MEETNNLKTFARSPQTTDDQLDNRFSHHGAPNEKQVAFYNACRSKCNDLAKWIAEHSPSSREQSLALTALEEVMFNANAACARNADQYQ